MNTIQANDRPMHYEYQFRDTTAAQRKELYDRLYDEAGNMRALKTEDFRVQDVPGWDGGKAGRMNGYAVAKVGDDYVVFAMNPGIYFSGKKELTEEHLTYLRGKYDRDNLSKEDRIKLLAELSCFGVISGSDAYAEAFAEKCPWVQKQRQQFKIDGNETDLADWIEYYLQRAMQAKDDMDKLSANNRFIVHVESERRAHSFYSTLAQTMKQIA